MRAPSTPAGVRWKGVSSAPESVVGIAATGAPVTPPIALAVSITRPPPRATSGTSHERRASSVGRDLVDAPRRHVHHLRRASGRAGALAAARSVVSSAYLPKPRLRQQIGRLSR